jgi:8-oxo-dGTP pyrophosphatase MutT (NUDIX family)
MAKANQRLRPEPDREPRTQYAALPWRRREDGALEILLITSRETRRWVIPKGWPIKGKKPGPSAAQEAFEEAGVIGDPSRKPLGHYSYDKRLGSGRLQHVRVQVYALKVRELAATWPEQGQREHLWASPAEAASLVQEVDLRVLIAKFGA